MTRSNAASQRCRPSYTDTRYSPMGFATARIAMLNTRIWSQPLMVILELLGTEECVDEGGEHGDRDDERDDALGVHGRPSAGLSVAPSALPSFAQKDT